MARLTRTQKFAELRETLANDKEETIDSKELSSYQNKLSNLTGEQYNYRPQAPVQRPIESDPRYTWRDFDETPINEMVNQFKKEEPSSIATSSVFNSIQEMPRSQGVSNDYDIAKLEEEDYIDDLVDSIRIDSNPSSDRPRQQAPSYQQPVYQQQQRPVYQQPSYQQPAYQQPQQPDYQQPVYQQPKQPAYEQPVYQQPQQPVYQQPSYQQPQQPVYQQPVEQPVYQRPIEQPAYEQPVNQQPVYEQPKAEPVVERPVEIKPAPSIEDRMSEIEAFADFRNTTISEPEKPAPVVEPRPIESLDIEAPARNTVELKTQKTVDPASSRTTFDMYDRIQDMFVETENEPVKEPEKAEFVDRLEPDHSNETARSFVSETIQEVSDYNKQNGEQTIGQLTNDMVNEIRHHEEPKPVKEKVEEIKFKGNDEDFTNTVSMEISKIMEEIPADRNVEVKPQPVVKEERPVVEEHPVLAKKLEDTPEEDVVEIKTLNEIEAEETLTRDTVSNTIPFVVTNDDDENEDEEEGSNTILNIILIVLIIILVVVLGLIVFYILKTKGVF